jgi:hypothetical protein
MINGEAAMTISQQRTSDKEKVIEVIRLLNLATQDGERVLATYDQDGERHDGLLTQLRH